MTLTQATTTMIIATAIVVFLSFSAVTFAAILLRNLAIILAIIGIDIGED